ncbi:DNA-binding protein [Marinicauda pacifica]|jgi:phage repressor protein C with HTH and peptisase S24 domain|uniref:Helix-turn-helix transcriptional regulator n=1 Tax=Marinicauda pacifica TaxID=1133559 RepID=A0A4S2HDF9_9PROT|nr:MULTISPECIES: helix-turn-helix transcriptional regulator [Marinicauda]TGY94085.1 helix-turn-helix transcriptional regulator [Marinicauda pacifica]GGE32751.1 DNA-binding protein [Marinicauda pacifica]
MLTHAQIWRGIDRLAERAGLSPSGLAREAGLDATTFNPSKRFASDGTKPRWPSTESLSKALFAARVSFDEFAGLATGREAGRAVPLIGLAQAGNAGFFDDAGFPAGSGWEQIYFPGVEDDQAYALEISGDSMRPVYRPGDRIVVAPHSQPRRGDRVVVKTRDGEVMAKELGRVTAETAELISLNDAYENRILAIRDMVWMARIVWASQ